MKKELVLDNSEEYDDPVLYDKENDFAHEIPFLLKWIKDTKGTIIDLACGTGRVTIPLAREGHRLIGVDIHENMLEQAKKKSSEQKLHIEWVEQDCTNLSLNVTSQLVYMVGNSFQHFLTNDVQDKLLKSVNEHLDKEGIFIFDTRFPSQEELLQPVTEEYWRTYVDEETNGEVDVYTISKYDSLNQIQHYTTIRRIKNELNLVIEEKKTNISLRYVYPKEMERLLAEHGFEIQHIYADWKETPVSNETYGMIYVCKKMAN